MPSKCEIIYLENEITSEHDIFDNYLHVEPIDASLLGVPILPGPSVDAALQSKCDNLKKAIDRLRFVDAHDAVVLLKNSLHLPKLLYTLRTSMCHENRILSEIDTITRDGLSEILNLTFTDDQWLQAGLQSKMVVWVFDRLLLWHCLHFLLQLRAPTNSNFASLRRRPSRRSLT